MNTKTDKNLNREILISETASEELSDENLEKVSGGLSLNYTKITYSSYSDISFTTLENKASPMLLFTL